MPLDHHVQPLSDLAWRDLDIALSTAASMQISIRHADTKAATLLGVQGGVATLAMGQAAALYDTGSTAVVVITAILSIALLVGLGGTTWHLVDAIAPRLTRPADPNRFAFPAITRPCHQHTTGDVRQQCDEAWRLVTVLGETAMAKHVCVRRSLPWIALTAICEGSILASQVLLGAMA